MALVAVHAVVHIPVDLRMAKVVRVISAMALRALEDRIIVRIRMARQAHTVRIAVRNREARVLRMNKRRRQPSRSRVTGRALRRWEERRLRRVSRIHRGVVRGLVAANAGQRQRRVVVVHVTAGARHRRVETRQRERCVVVIERRICPQHSVMAQLAGRREARMRHRRRGTIKSGLVTRNARRHRYVVVVVDVAQGARCRQVRPHQRESRRRVIELPIRPHHRVVAPLARRREGRMIHRRLCAGVGSQMAGNARGHCNVVVVVGMA